MKIGCVRNVLRAGNPRLLQISAAVPSAAFATTALRELASDLEMSMKFITHVSAHELSISELASGRSDGGYFSNQFYEHKHSASFRFISSPRLSEREALSVLKQYHRQKKNTLCDHSSEGKRTKKCAGGNKRRRDTAASPQLNDLESLSASTYLRAPQLGPNFWNLLQTRARRSSVEDTQHGSSHVFSLGLAAPTIGVPLRVIVIPASCPCHRYPDAPYIPHPLVICNPIINAITADAPVALSDMSALSSMGALSSNLGVTSPAAMCELFEESYSLSQMGGLVLRPKEIVFSGFTPEGEPIAPQRAIGWYARALQMHMDTLNGVALPQKITDWYKFGYVRELAERGLLGGHAVRASPNISAHLADRRKGVRRVALPSGVNSKLSTLARHLRSRRTPSISSKRKAIS